MTPPPPPTRSNADLVVRLVAWKALLFLLVLLSAPLLPPLFSIDAWNSNFHWPPGGLPTPSSMLKTWDAEHYLYLSEFGYHPGSKSVAFYPLWPLCIRAFSWLTFGNHLAAGLLLANLLSVAALVLLHRFVATMRGARVADLTLLLTLAFPGAIFYLFVYSESLFLLLSVLLFRALQREKAGLAGLAAFLMPLARPVGILCVVPLAVHLWMYRRRPSSLALLLLPVTGYLAYFVFMYLSTGNPFLGFFAQEHFIARSSVLQLFDPVHFLRALFQPLELHGFFNSAIDRVWFGWFCLSLIPLWRLDRRLFAFALVMGLVPAMTVSLMAYTRYIAVVFPLFLVTAEALGEGRRVWGLYTLAGALLMIQGVFLIRHVNFHWAG